MNYVDDQEELLKIYDDQLRYLGVKRRQDVHESGDLHYVIHCWVWLLKTDQILIQKRGKDKAFAANRYDVSCAGHYSADESFTSTRELVEELGLEVAYEHLDHLFDFEEYFQYKTYKDREIARVHLLKYLDDHAFKSVSKEEVSGIFRVDRKALIALFNGDQKSVLLEEEGILVTAELKDFVQRSPEYYQKMSVCLTL